MSNSKQKQAHSSAPPTTRSTAIIAGKLAAMATSANAEEQSATETIGISGRVRALNLTVLLGSGRVGSDDLGYGPGSGFSFEPVQTSNLSPWTD